MLKILAALVLVTATNSFSSIFPVTCRETAKQIWIVYNCLQASSITTHVGVWCPEDKDLVERSATGFLLWNSGKTHFRNLTNSLCVGHLRAIGSKLLTTALSQTTDILSSIPLVPSGIKVKLSFPTAFWAVEKLACALDVTCRSPLKKHTTSTCQVHLVHLDI